jgi:hypothetical protein
MVHKLISADIYIESFKLGSTLLVTGVEGSDRRKAWGFSTKPVC